VDVEAVRIGQLAFVTVRQKEEALSRHHERPLWDHATVKCSASWRDERACTGERAGLVAQ